MSSHVMKIVDIVEDIKTQISDLQYKNILESLGELHRLENVRSLEVTYVVRTEPYVTRLIYSIVRSKNMNGGKLAYILNEKGFHFSDYFFQSFKDWMAENGVSVQGRHCAIVENILM